MQQRGIRPAVLETLLDRGQVRRGPGNSEIVRSTSRCISVDCVRLVDAIRIACIAMSFSSRVGTNSCPSRMNRRSEPRNASTATGTTIHRARIAQPTVGS